MEFIDFEVKNIRKIISFCVALVLVLSMLPVGIQADAASATQAGQVKISNGWLNVRSSASSDASIVAKLYKDSFVTLHSRSGDWWKVEYADGRHGYCHSSYIRRVDATSATVQTKSSALNVRTGAGTSHTIVTALPKGTAVLVLSASNGWSRILYHGTKTGYVSSQYLSGGNTAVSLAVPSFKQNDSRWAQVKIGQSGKTFAQIGCATTAIAMMESYRTGTAIYPDAMAQKLRYTPTGDVYWPENYHVVTSNDGYLNAIYEKLKSGKPVLFGARNRYGSQHWVVITGFTGGELTEASFTIQDPGTYSRTNLQQFLNSYPNFYKYFYY